MKEEKFQVINFIRKLILEIDKELSNFPKKDIELKNRIRNNSYDLLELSYEANATTNIENKRKILDFLLNLCYDKMIINHKKYIKLGEKMDDIIKYTIGWLNSIDKIRAQLSWLGSRSVNANDNNANFNVREVDSGDVNNWNLFNANTDGNTNENENACGVRPVASINCGYTITNCIRDNIETDYVLQLNFKFSYKVKIDKYICQQVFKYSKGSIFQDCF